MLGHSPSHGMLKLSTQAAELLFKICSLGSAVVLTLILVIGSSSEANIL
jgi:hypothetical protein